MNLTIDLHIKENRINKDIGLNQLSKRSDIAIGYLSEMEQGIKSNPSIRTLCKIAVALDVKPEDLYSYHVH